MSQQTVTWQVNDLVDNYGVSESDAISIVVSGKYTWWTNLAAPIYVEIFESHYVSRIEAL